MVVLLVLLSNEQEKRSHSVMKHIFIRSILGLLFLVMANPIFAAETSPGSTVTLDQAIHFLASDGSDVVVGPGTYQVEAAEEWLRVIPGERREAWLLEATPTRHEETLDAPVALAVSGEEDHYHMIVLLPGGTGLETIGSVSGVRSRRATSRRRLSKAQIHRSYRTRQPRYATKRTRPTPSQGRRMTPGTNQVPVQNPHASTVPNPDSGAPPVVINPDRSRIRITSFSAVSDVSSKKRQIRLHFTSTGAIPTHYRVTQGTSVAGVPWIPYHGGDPQITLGCPWSDNSVLLQVKGANRPHPRLSGQSIENISVAKQATFQLNETLQTRITRFGHVRKPYRHSQSDASQPPSYVAMAFLVEVENFPGQLDHTKVQEILGNCFHLQRVEPYSESGNQLDNWAGGKIDNDTTAFWAIGTLNPNVTTCKPQLMIPACGSSPHSMFEHYSPDNLHQRHITILQTEELSSHVVYEHSASTLPGCTGLEKVNGDWSVKTEGPSGKLKGCEVTVEFLTQTLPGGVTWRSHTWNNDALGQCGLGPTFFQQTMGSALVPYLDFQCKLKGLCLDRQPDIGRSPNIINPTDIGQRLSPWGGDSIQHACGLKGGKIRTWLDKVKFAVLEGVNFLGQ